MDAFHCGSELARDGGLTDDRVLAAVLRPNCGSDLLAKAAWQPT